VNVDYESQQQWCQLPNGAVEPCRQCCFTLSEPGKERSFYEKNSCEQVFNPDFFTWAANPALGCTDPDFPVKTRFGCCPAASLPPSGAPSVILGDGQEVPACSLTGPNKDAWYFCKEELETIQAVNSSATASVPAGCKIYSNGKWTGENYCRPPSFL
jgi:hypothetical protein